MPKTIFIVFVILLSNLNYSDQLGRPHKVNIEKDSFFGSKKHQIVQNIECSSCTYIVSDKDHKIDGKELGLRPGDIICLNHAFKYGPLKFLNLKGTIENPISIVNCGGQVQISVNNNISSAISISDSQYFKFSGSRKSKDEFGIVVSGAHKVGLSLDNLSSNFEVSNVEIFDIGFAGIMAKTDPTCDDQTVRGNFVMRDISLHDNYIHDTGGEGLYIGNSFYESGFKTNCGVRLPHEINGVKVFNNVIKNSGWESIQIGSATQGAEIFGNTIENFGVANQPSQNNGIQIGVGTGGLCYNNLLKNGSGNGIIVLGLGDNIIFNNIIINAGQNGIFCDERYTPGIGFKIINNTIINPKGDGIRMYSDLVPTNIVVNNLIVNPGTFDQYDSVQSHNAMDSYVYKLNEKVNIDMGNNFFTRNIESVYFIDPDNFNYNLMKKSPVIDEGRDVSNFNITFDFLNHRRPRKKGFDIGAYEY